MKQSRINKIVRDVEKAEARLEKIDGHGGEKLAKINLRGNKLRKAVKKMIVAMEDQPKLS